MFQTKNLKRIRDLTENKRHESHVGTLIDYLEGMRIKRLQNIMPKTKKIIFISNKKYLKASASIIIPDLWLCWPRIWPLHYDIISKAIALVAMKPGPVR